MNEREFFARVRETRHQVHWVPGGYAFECMIEAALRRAHAARARRPRNFTAQPIGVTIGAGCYMRRGGCS